jgi:hypothetical protein
LETVESSRIRALVVGINNYNACRKLKYAVNDAVAMGDILKQYCNCKDPILMVDSANDARLTPLGQNILTYIDLIAQTATENDNLIFYFSGHGDDVEGEPALLPQDFREERGVSSAIKIEDIKTALINSKAKFKLLILDSCHSGSAEGREENGSMSKEMFDAINVAPEGFAIISGCTLNQKSYEDDDFQHGIFTNYLMEGISGKADANNDSKVTVGDLYEYITPKVKERAYVKLMRTQIPHFKACLSGVFVLSNIPKLPNVETKSENFGNDLVSRIYLQTETFEMSNNEYEALGFSPAIEDMAERIERSTTLALMKVYTLAGLKKTNEGTIFKDGSLLREVNTIEERNEAKLTLRLQVDYNKENWTRVDRLIHEVDNLALTWEKIKFQVRNAIEIAKVEAFCRAKNLEISDIDLDEPQKIEFITDFFYDTSNKVSVTFYPKHTIIGVSTEHSHYQKLDEYFYTVINPKKIAELASNWL